MSSTPASKLDFATANEPLPSVEVDLDSIPHGYYGYADIVARALQRFVEKSPTARSTVYVMQTNSVNFHEPTYSAFFVVAGKGSALDHILRAFKAIPNVRVRHSDYIRFSQGTAQFHVQDGLVWQPEDLLTWYSIEAEASALETDAASTKASEGAIALADDLRSEDDSDSGVDDVAIDPSAEGVAALRTTTPNGLRYRKARADASVGAIRRSIESTFGLPAGAVKICGPDGKPLRSDALIGTLRKRWD